MCVHKRPCVHVCLLPSVFILLHGSPGVGLSWRYVLAQLPASLLEDPSLSFVMPTRGGYGTSAAAPANHTLLDVARHELVPLVQHLRLPQSCTCYIVGQSGGGPHALALAALWGRQQQEGVSPRLPPLGGVVSSAGATKLTIKKEDAHLLQDMRENRVGFAACYLALHHPFLYKPFVWLFRQLVLAMNALLSPSTCFGLLKTSISPQDLV